MSDGHSPSSGCLDASLMAELLNCCYAQLFRAVVRTVFTLSLLFLLSNKLIKKHPLQKKRAGFCLIHGGVLARCGSYFRQNQQQFLAFAPKPEHFVLYPAPKHINILVCYDCFIKRFYCFFLCCDF